MIVTVSLTGDTESKLRESIERGDSESVRRLLVDAIAPTVESLLQRPPSEELTDEEFERLADQLADEVGEALGPDAPLLSDYAVSREGIYGEHP